jgi:N-carbamoylputrescine amidase
MEQKIKSATNLRVGLIQQKNTESLEINFERTINKINELSAKGVQVICLQELFLSLYFCDTQDETKFDLAEPIPGLTTDILSDLAKKNNVVLIASLFEDRTKGIYHNSTVVIDADGKYLGKYRKTHIPEDPGFHEKYYFTPGDENYQVFHTAYGKLGILTCWDQWFPEPARIMALKGADIILYPSAIGWELGASKEVNEEEYNAWQTVQKGHAIANGIPVMAVNRVGIEGETNFWGGSFACNAFGKLLYQASHIDDDTYYVDFDLEETEKYRRRWPFFRDRRMDTYKPILQRYIEEK